MTFVFTTCDDSGMLSSHEMDQINLEMLYTGVQMNKNESDYSLLMKITDFI